MTITRLWSLACDLLETQVPEKHLYLRRHNHDFLKGTLAQYECEAGYGFENISQVTWYIFQYHLGIGYSFWFCIEINTCFVIFNSKQPTIFNLTCLWNGTWDIQPSSLPACQPLECQKPPFDPGMIDPPIGAELSYRLLLSTNKSLFGTTFKLECPETSVGSQVHKRYFINRIPSFEAICQHDGYFFCCFLND